MSFDISLDLYKMFCTVVRTGSMSLAAKEMYVSQPAVSMAVKQLEERLGKPLLLRSQRGIKTTPEGHILYEYLSQAMGLIDTAEKKYMEMANLEMGEIKIGAGDTISCQFLTPYIEKFMLTYPSINIKVTNRTTMGTILLLKSGAVDFGFVNLPIEENQNIEVLECMEITDCLIGGDKFKELAKEGVSVENLSKYTIMALEKDSNSRGYIDKHIQKSGFTLQANIELGSSDLLVKFAKINLGLAFVIREFTDIDNKNIYEIPLYPEIPSRHVGMIKLKNVPLSYSGSKFIETLK